MDRVVINVIRPSSRKRGLNCSKCNLRYSLRDYDALIQSKKLIYFKYKPSKVNRVRTYCHECVLRAIKEDFGVDPIPILIIDDDYEYKCKYYPNDIDDDDFSHPFKEVF